MKLLPFILLFCLSCNAQKYKAQTDSLQKVVFHLQCDNKKLTEELKAITDSLAAYRKRDEELRNWLQSLLNRE